MTLILSTNTSYGIVLSADSRQTYRNKAGMIRVGSDSAMKLFQLSDRIGVAISGRAFLTDAQGTLKNTGWYVEQFRKEEMSDDWTVKQTAEKLSEYIASWFVDKEFELLRKQIEDEVSKIGGSDLTILDPEGEFLPYSYVKDGSAVNQKGKIEAIHLLVAGIDDDGIGRTFSVVVPTGITGEKNTSTCGAVWAGQTDILARIVLGFDPQIGELGFFQQADQEGRNSMIQDLKKLEYIINWGTMTLQDAVDFTTLITRTTESIQRFSDGTMLHPGGITGVGGDVDIAIITPEKGFLWLKKKHIISEGAVLNLDEASELFDSEEE